MAAPAAPMPPPLGWTERIWYRLFVHVQSSPEKPGTPLCLEIVSEIKNMYLIYFRISVEYGYVWGSYAIVLVVLPLVLLRVPKFINLSEQQLFFVALYVTTFEYLDYSMWTYYHLWKYSLVLYVLIF